ncbi:hypothetical protein EAG_13598 [Camponotus floridanus]|uniref:Uncharacterized protein n=1 Tax=Camponotus floridanus TaxID=104421 RepID=E2A989_CAMFO|nr:hypothetical protein EAG_13598 [Camponotus floridanus]
MMKMMEEKVVSGLERREETESNRSEVRKEEKDVEAGKKKAEGRKIVKEEGCEQEAGRKVEEPSSGKKGAVERRRGGRGESEQRERAQEKGQGGAKEGRKNQIEKGRRKEKS